MSRGSFISSAVLHGVVLTLMAVDFSLAEFDKTPPPPAILTVDLTRVQIADKTNLPPKVQTKPKQQPKKATPPPAKPKAVTPTKVQAKQPDPPKPKPIPQPPVKDAAPVVEKTKQDKKVPDKKEQPKPTPKPETKPEPKPDSPKKPTTDDKLKNLLASVEKVRQTAPITSSKPEPETMQMSEGIEGGEKGSLSQLLTISERDLIATQLSACWNLDAGKKDIENIIIEIRASVNKDGSVREVKILNKNLNAVHQSVAESAKRAILICDKKGDASPFRILADKYADHYGDWKTMHLRFNPLTGLFQ